jgi:hypothetical protein
MLTVGGAGGAVLYVKVTVELVPTFPALSVAWATTL